PVAVLILDRGGCVKTLNCTAQRLFGDRSEGQAWPLLRNATFQAKRGSNLLTARDGRQYFEQHSAKMSSDERIICLQAIATMAADTESLAQLGEGVAHLIHQVRTPLTAASLYLDQLVRQLGHEPKLQQLARKPSTQLRAAEQVISSALDLLVPRASQLEHVNVQELMLQLQEQCGVVTLSLGAHLYCVPVPEGIYLKAEQSALLSALGNLVVNAAQHPAKGRLLRICVLARVEADNVIFEISDTGTGIAEEMKHKVFDRFETTRVGGTGLGLDIARRVFEQFDGHVYLSNNAEGGATFSVRFPCQAIDVAA
ncbi:MAG: sensor histidine kinase, partial [Granulosicoccaceae bacterium]